MTTTPVLPLDDLSAAPNIRKMRSNIWMDYSLGKDKDWVKTLLLELNENSVELSEEDKINNSHLDLDFRIKKAQKGSIGEYLLCELQVDTEFNTLCVKSGAPMKDTMSFEVKMCFLPHELSSKEEFVDQTEHFTDGEVFELYFLNEQGEAPLQDAIHEQLFLNLDYYPNLENG